MTTYSDRALVAIPAALIEAANWLAAVVDPDTRGAQTFTADRTMTISGVEHVYSIMPFTTLMKSLRSNNQ